MTTRSGRTSAAEEIHEIFLMNLHGEKAKVVTSSDVLAAMNSHGVLHGPVYYCAKAVIL